MEYLGYYAKYGKSENERPERLCLTVVKDEWSSGFCIETYQIEPGFVYFEDACWNGKVLDYGRLGIAVKPRKIEVVRKMISGCRQELEYMGMVCERVDVPDIYPDNCFYAYTEIMEDGVTEERFSAFYRILSVLDGNITYRCISINDHYLCVRERDCTVSREDFLECPDITRWYQVPKEVYGMVGSKIDFMTGRILEKFRRIKE